MTRERTDVTAVIEHDTPAAAADREQRVRDLSAALDAITKEVRVARRERNAAMLSALLDHGADPIDCYTPAGINRNAFAKLAKKARREAGAGRGAVKEVFRRRYPDKAAALRAIAEYARQTDEAIARADEARTERDDLILPMIHGETLTPDGGTYTEQEVADLIGRSSARVAQMKAGHR